MEKRKGLGEGGGGGRGANYALSLNIAGHLAL